MCNCIAWGAGRDLITTYAFHKMREEKKRFFRSYCRTRIRVQPSERRVPQPVAPPPEVHFPEPRKREPVLAPSEKPAVDHVEVDMTKSEKSRPPQGGVRRLKKQISQKLRFQAQ